MGDRDTGHLRPQLAQVLTTQRWGHQLTGAVSPLGTLLATAGTDRAVRLWDPGTGRCRYTHFHAVRALAFAPDGRLLATCGDDKHVRLWSAATGRLLHAVRPPGRWNYVNHVAFVPGGRLLAGYGLNRKMWLWDLRPADGR